MTDQPAPTPEGLQVGIHAQYIRDFSFENPNAPQIYAPTKTAPVLNMNVNVNTRGLDPNVFEVVLKLKIEATVEDKTAFIAELAYAGLFGLPALPEEHQKAFLLIEAPRLLFPFARSILTHAIIEGGFPPVPLQPIDFASLYHQQQAQMTAPQGTA
jgi:preprotein translocase subunit SecB